jgi:hypothetical protein
MNGEDFRGSLRELRVVPLILRPGASADIELRSPYLRDLLDETPRNTVKASVVAVAAASIHASSSTSNMLPDSDANAWD